MADEMYHTHSSRAKRNLPLSHGDWSSTTAHRLDQQQAGDMIYATATTGALSRLGIGTAGQFLTVNSSGLPEWSSTVSSDRIFEDNIDIELGTGSDTLIRFSTADSDNHVTVIALDDTSQSLHFTDKGAVATDWNLSANTHPTLYLHSNTTPITDYLRVGAHDGTNAYIDIVGGTTIHLQVAGADQFTLTASAADFQDNSITTTGTLASGNLTVTGTGSTSSTFTVGTDLTVTGGDITYGNGQAATIGITAVAHDAAGQALSIAAGATTAGTSNDQAGGALTLKGGIGKGSGAGGAIIFQVANAGGSGSSLNSLATALTINDDSTITTAGAIELGHGSDTTLARSGSGDLTIEGNAIYRAGGTDVAVTDGGTGASSLNNLITLGTHTTGNYVATITGGTGIDSDAATSCVTTNHSLSVDLYVVTEVALADGDSIAFMDATDSNATKRETIADVATLFAGTNLTAASSVINLDASPTFTSASANEPLITVTNTHADATAGILKFIKDPGSGQGADSDILGTITFFGTDASNNAPEELARIESYIIEADHGSEAAGMKFYVAENDATMAVGLSLLGQASDDGEIDVTIALGAASTTTVSGGLVITGSTATVGGNYLYRAGGTDIPVADGGTGASTLLANAVLTGNGTSAIQAESALLFSSNKLIPTASAHDAAGTALTVSAGATTAGTSNNQAGGALTLQAGVGKGSGAGGDIVFQTANAGGSGSSLNSLATALTISDDLSSTFAGAVVFGSDGSGVDVTFHSGTGSDLMLWDASEEVLQITGTNGATSLDVLDGDVRIVDTLYFYDRGGEHISSSGSLLTITGILKLASTTYINDSANGDVTMGLTINQGSNTDKIFALKASGVDHGRTGRGEVDTFLNVMQASSNFGGVIFDVLSEDGANDIVYSTRVSGGTASTAKTTSGYGLVTLDVEQHDGANSSDNIAANGNVYTIRAQVGGAMATRILVDEDGDLYSVTSAQTFDSYDDALMIRALETTRGDTIRSEFDQFVKYNEKNLIEAGILGDTMANGGLTNMSQLMRLQNGAIWQNYTYTKQLEQKVNHLEQKVLLLEGAT